MKPKHKSDSNKLPIVTINSDIIDIAILREISEMYLKNPKNKALKIVSIDGVSEAVLVDYNQYMHFQDTFDDISEKMSMVNQLLSRLLDSKEPQISKLKLEVAEVLRRTNKESPEPSPFTDLLSMLAADSCDNQPKPAPAELKDSAQRALSSSAIKVTKTPGLLKTKPKK